MAMAVGVSGNRYTAVAFRDSATSGQKPERAERVFRPQGLPHLLVLPSGLHVPKVPQTPQTAALLGTLCSDTLPYEEGLTLKVTPNAQVTSGETGVDSQKSLDPK